jgi:hypothetical protein
VNGVGEPRKCGPAPDAQERNSVPLSVRESVLNGVGEPRKCGPAPDAQERNSVPLSVRESVCTVYH